VDPNPPEHFVCQESFCLKIHAHGEKGMGIEVDNENLSRKTREIHKRSQGACHKKSSFLAPSELLSN
jgi:hypothetical protein